MTNINDQAVAYLRECGQLINDIEWVRELLADANPDVHEIAIEHMYRTGLNALSVVHGEAPGKPEILAKVMAES